MELQIYQPVSAVEVLPISQPIISSSKTVKKPFVEANTTEVQLYHLKHDCVIPVFAKDNERTISHQEFIETAIDSIEAVFGEHQSLKPEIRVSHTIKGRTPDAIHKSAYELLEHEKTIYYERMAFAIEIPSVTRNIGGNELKLTVGGVRAYNHENLYNKKSLEHFKFFIGFKNMVCCNMCVSSDGFVEDLRAANTQQLYIKILEVLQSYRVEHHLQQMNQLTQLSITESQFAQILGKCRLHQYLSKDQKKEIPSLQFNDTQINAVARDYFQDKSFARNSNGEINLWKMYNLFTGANKTSYIDLFLQRSINSFELATGIGEALQYSDSFYRWFIE